MPCSCFSLLILASKGNQEEAEANLGGPRIQNPASPWPKGQHFGVSIPKKGALEGNDFLKIAELDQAAGFFVFGSINFFGAIFGFYLFEPQPSEATGRGGGGKGVTSPGHGNGPLLSKKESMAESPEPNSPATSGQQVGKSSW